jgi:hypothetical protein
VFQQLSDPAFHLPLVKAAQQVDAVAVGIAAVPVFVDLLTQPKRRGRKIVRQPEQAGLVFDIDILAPSLRCRAEMM